MDVVITEAFGRHWTMKDLKNLRHYLLSSSPIQSDDDYSQWESIYRAIDSIIKKEDALNGVKTWKASLRK